MFLPPRGAVLLALTLAASGCLAAPSPKRAGEPAKRPHVVLVIGEDHSYGAEGSLRSLARELEAKHGMRCTLLKVTSYTDLPGLEALRDADLAVFYIRRRLLPPEQMKHIRDYLSAGKPLVAFRTTSHAFAPRGGKVPDGVKRWDRFDREVLGCNYAGHDRGDTEVRAAPEAAEHPILRGVKGPYRLHETLYRSRPLAATCKLLLTGKSLGSKRREEPVAWTNTYKGGRVFYTSLGSRATFKEAWFRRMVINAIYWALDRPVPGS